MDYLTYVSRDAENLQFYLWLEGYRKRFPETSHNEQALSPRWPGNDFRSPRAIESIQSGESFSTIKAKVQLSEEFRLDFDSGKHRPNTSRRDYEEKQNLASGPIALAVDDANAQAGLKWASCEFAAALKDLPGISILIRALLVVTIQPFRSEVANIITHYFAADAPRELNLSHRTRTTVLHALQHTTHPSAFAPAADVVEATLRGQCHPNFIRWSICNGNRPRVVFVRYMGIIHFLGGLTLAIFLILSDTSRWWRIFAFALLYVGIDIGVAAWKGLCMIIHTGRNRALRPWEQFDGDTESTLSQLSPPQSSEGAPSSFDHKILGPSTNGEEVTLALANPNRSTPVGSYSSVAPFGPSNSIRAENDRWVSLYQRKPLLQKIFARKVWVQNATIRLLQDRIVMQSHFWALMVTLPIMVVLIAAPRCGVL